MADYDVELASHFKDEVYTEPMWMRTKDSANASRRKRLTSALTQATFTFTGTNLAWNAEVRVYFPGNDGSYYYNLVEAGNIACLTYEVVWIRLEQGNNTITPINHSTIANFTRNNDQAGVTGDIFILGITDGTKFFPNFPLPSSLSNETTSDTYTINSDAGVSAEVVSLILKSSTTIAATIQSKADGTLDISTTDPATQLVTIQDAFSFFNDVSGDWTELIINKNNLEYSVIAFNYDYRAFIEHWIDVDNYSWLSLWAWDDGNNRASIDLISRDIGAGKDGSDGSRMDVEVDWSYFRNIGVATYWDIQIPQMDFTLWPPNTTEGGVLRFGPGSGEAIWMYSSNTDSLGYRTWEVVDRKYNLFLFYYYDKVSAGERWIYTEARWEFDTDVMVGGVLECWHDLEVGGSLYSAQSGFFDLDIYADIVWLNASASVNGGDGFRVGYPTGGFKGDGTINAVAVYDDNVLLTDWVYDLANDGVMSPEDIKKHGNKKIWTIEELETFTKENRHLPFMPSRANWEKGSSPVGILINGLWETVEQLQLQIAELNKKCKN